MRYWRSATAFTARSCGVLTGSGRGSSSPSQPSLSLARDAVGAAISATPKRSVAGKLEKRMRAPFTLSPGVDDGRRLDVVGDAGRAGQLAVDEDLALHDQGIA